MRARPRPRVHLAPHAASSDGDDACFLAASYGLTPDDWQEDILGWWLGRRRDGRWAAATCALAVPRQNGKNGIIEVRELFGMVALGEKFLHTAHEVKTARKAFLRIASFFENERQYPELAALVPPGGVRKTNGQEAIVLRNGGSVEFVARSRGSGRGFTVDVLVCDEAQELSDEELAALLPTISAAPSGNPQVIITGTPPKPERGEVFRRVRADGVSGADARLCWDDYGVADGPLPDVDDRSTWPRHNPAMGTRLAMAEAERERSLMSPEDFAAERLGWWGNPDTGTGVVDAASWVRCQSEPEDIAAPLVLTVETSSDRSRTVLTIVGSREDGVPQAEVVEDSPGTDWVPGRVGEIVAVNGVGDVVVDPTSAAKSLIPDLRTILEPLGVELTEPKSADVAEAYGLMFDAIHTDPPGIRHLGDRALNEAVSSAENRDLGDGGKAWSRRKGGPIIAPLVGVTLGLWRWRQLTTNGYDVLDSIG